jgi:chromosome segregation ATPase
VNWVVVGSIAAALIAPVGAYLLAARRMSGKIATSDASQLWQESKSIRDDYRARLNDAADRAMRLEVRVADLEGTNTKLIQENFELRHKVEALEELVKSQAATIKGLEELVKAQREELGNGPT